MTTRQLITTAMILGVLSGCGQRELDCKNPRNPEEKQHCAHKEATEPRISPTEKPKNWLEVKP